MRKKPLVLILVTSFGILGFVTIFLVFRNDGVEESSENKNLKNLGRVPSQREIEVTPDLSPSPLSAIKPSPANPHPSFSNNPPASLYPSQNVPAVSKVSVSTFESQPPALPFQTSIPQSNSVSQPALGTNTNTLNTSLTSPPSSTSSINQLLTSPNNSTSISKLPISPTPAPAPATNPSRPLPIKPKVTAPTNLSIVENYFSGLTDRKLARQLEAMFKKESTVEDFKKLRNGEAVDDTFSIMYFRNSVCGEFYDFIHKARSIRDFGALRVAADYYSKILRVEEISSEVFFSTPPKTLGDFILDQFSRNLTNNIMNPHDEKPFNLEAVRDSLALMKDLSNFIQEDKTTCVAHLDPSKLDEAFKNAAIVYITIKSRPQMYRLLCLRDRAGYEKVVNETKTFMKELSLDSAIPSDFFNNVESIFQETSKTFEGTVVLASDPPRPVINRPGNYCFAIATLQAFATFFPTFQPSSKMDLSANDTPAMFVKIMRELVSGNTSAFDIRTTPTLPAITVTLSTSIGHPGVFFDNLQTALRNETVKARGLDLELILRVVSKNNVTQAYDYVASLHETALNPKYFSDSTVLSNAGALLVFTFRNTDIPSQEDIPMQFEASAPFSLVKRKFLLGALVCNVGGHSVAFLKRQNGKWYLADDANIYIIREDQIPLKVASQQKPTSLGSPITYGTTYPCIAFYYLH